MSDSEDRKRQAEGKVTDELANQAQHHPDSEGAEKAKQARVPAEKELTQSRGREK